MVDSDNRNNSTSQSSAGTGEAKERARQTADEVKDAAQHQVEGLFNQQKEAAAEQAEKLSTVFRKMAEEFDAQDQSYFSGYANNIARCTDSLSQRLREKDLGSLMSQAQAYSRRQPAVFIGGAVAVGFLLARFLRSSNRQNTTGNANSATGSGMPRSSTSPGGPATTSTSPGGSPSSAPY